MYGDSIWRKSRGKFSITLHSCILLVQGRSNHYGLYGQSRTGFWPNDKLLTKFINICDYRFLIFIVIIVAAGACVDGGYEYCQCSRA